MSLTYEDRRSLVVSALTDQGAVAAEGSDLTTLAAAVLSALDTVKESVR